MKKDTQKTKVLFLMEQPDSDISANVFAFFPEERYNTIENGTFTCYAHIGQHSACHIDYANKCTQATQEQYTDLKIELEGLGYDLEVLNEQPPAPIKEEGRHTPENNDIKCFDCGNDTIGGICNCDPLIMIKDQQIYFNEALSDGRTLAYAYDEQAGEEIVRRYNEHPTLLKKNEQLKEQVNVLREALQLLTNSTNLSKLNIRKDFTLINAHANGLKALKKTETN